jgi:hypothetical protein
MPILDLNNAIRIFQNNVEINEIYNNGVLIILRLKYDSRRKKTF